MSKKIRLLCLLFVAVLCISAGACAKKDKTKNKQDDFTFEERGDYIWMTYNVSGDSEPDTVSERADAFCAYLRVIQPDVVGVQEAASAWRKRILADGAFAANRYAMADGKRDGLVEVSEAVPILYRTDRFTLLENDTFWLSETPDRRSIGFGSKSYRACTWARLRDRNSGQEFVVMNTQLDTVDKVREKEVALIQSKAEEFGDIPVILTGDMNLRQGSDLYGTIREGLFEDAKVMAHTVQADRSSLVEEWDRGSNAKPSDFIFLTNWFYVTYYGVDIGRYRDENGVDRTISDHSAVYVRASFLHAM